jgi:hypothetical protein
MAACEFAFLGISQVALLIVWGPHLEKHWSGFLNSEQRVLSRTPMAGMHRLPPDSVAVNFRPPPAVGADTVGWEGSSPVEGNELHDTTKTRLSHFLGERMF